MREQTKASYILDIMLFIQLLHHLLSQNFIFFIFPYSHSPFFSYIVKHNPTPDSQLMTLCICFSTEVTFDHPRILHLWDRHSGIITTNGLQMHESSSACFGEDYTESQLKLFFCLWTLIVQRVATFIKLKEHPESPSRVVLVPSFQVGTTLCCILSKTG